ncbi:MAG: hypothetical protein AB7S41_11395 [Parvibaculaceae bacterium]
MAKISEFTGRAGRRERPTVSAETGGAASFLELAKASGEFASTLGRLADRRAAVEGEEAGIAAGLDAKLPSDPSLSRVPRSSPLASPLASPLVPDDRAAAIRRSASELGIDAQDLASVIAYETAGSFSPAQRGGKGNAYLGLIQFGPEEQRRFGVSPDQTFSQQMQAVTAFLKERGLKPGMGIDDLYSTILAGSPGLYGRSDGRNTVTGHLASPDFQAYRTKAAALMGGGMEPPRIEAASDVARAPALRLLDPATIRGQAFNRAALDTYGDRLKTSAIVQMERIFAKHPDDPLALDQELEEFRQGYGSDIPTPQLRAEFESAYQRNKLGLMREASTAATRRQKDEWAGAFLGAYEMRRANLVRLATRAGTGAEGDKALAGELDAIAADMEASPLSAVDKAKLRQDLGNQVTVARVMGEFDRMEGAALRAGYADAFERLYAANASGAKDISPDAYEDIQRAMAARLNRDEMDANRHAQKTSADIKGSMKMLEEGFRLSSPDMAALEAKVTAAADPDVAARFQFFKTLSSWQGQAVGARPEQVAPQIAAAETALRETGATPERIEALKLMRGLHERMEKGLKDDPLGWAEQAGLGSSTPLDFASREGLQASLAVRQSEAKAVASYYGRPAKFFRPGEAATIERAVAERPDALLDFAVSVRRAFGTEDVPRALSEISKEAPVVAHSAGVAIATESTAILEKTAAALKLRQLDGHEAAKVSPATQRTATIEALGPALQALPATEAAAIKQAELLFELTAHQQGLDPSANPQKARAAWEAALDEALGGREANGRKVGGLGTINGVQTLLPPAMSEDELQTVVENITDADLAALPEIAAPNAVPVAARQVAQGKLVAVAPGTYRVALGDPASDEPLFLADPAGKPWTLDIGRLLTLRASATQARGARGLLSPEATREPVTDPYADLPPVDDPYRSLFR